MLLRHEFSICMNFEGGPALLINDLEAHPHQRGVNCGVFEQRLGILHPEIKLRRAGVLQRDASIYSITMTDVSP